MHLKVRALVIKKETKAAIPSADVNQQIVLVLTFRKSEIDYFSSVFWADSYYIKLAKACVASSASV